MKQIICIKWGAKFGPEYVNRMYGMVARNITPPFRLICFTDDTTGLRPEIEPRPLPEFSYQAPVNTRGKWPKSRLWGDLGDITGEVLFLDLDAIIVGSLDDFFTYGEPGDTVLARNPNTPLEKLGQTSVYRMRVGSLKPLQELFRADPQGIADRYKYEQRFVTRNAPGGVKFWPKAWVAHFRFHCIPAFPANYLIPPRIPKGARIVIFPGNLNPHDAIEGRWSPDDPARSRGEHLHALFGDRREPALKHLRHFYLPAPWIEELWRE